MTIMWPPLIICRGKFSLVELNKMMNETQNRAAEYYKWFKVRVDDYAKL